MQLSLVPDASLFSNFTLLIMRCIYFRIPTYTLYISILSPLTGIRREYCRDSSVANIYFSFFASRFSYAPCARRRRARLVLFAFRMPALHHAVYFNEFTVPNFFIATTSAYRSRMAELPHTIGTPKSPPKVPPRFDVESPIEFLSLLISIEDI